MVLTGRKKKSINKRKSIIEEEKEKEEKVPTIFFENFKKNEELFLMPEPSEGEAQEEKDNQYAGDVKDKMANGKGKQVLISKGFTFSGTFVNGKKHGEGYLVNENLDTLECQFLDDRLVGI